MNDSIEYLQEQLEEARQLADQLEGQLEHWHKTAKDEYDRADALSKRLLEAEDKLDAALLDRDFYRKLSQTHFAAALFAAFIGIAAFFGLAAVCWLRHGQ